MGIPTGFTSNSNSLGLRLVLYALWGIGLLLSAQFTELLDDEAYYWVYSQNLALGYHDHPPLVAWTIYLGYSLFKSELGVRLGMLLFHLGTLRLLEHIIQPKSILFFFSVCLSITAFQFSGFWAVPDTPFLFSVVFFLFMSKKYYSNPNWLHALGLGFAAAFVLYSKYHGALLILSMLVFGYKMLFRPSFYLTVLLAVALYLPHFVWLIDNNFPTLVYHFGYRNSNPYKLSQTLTFLGGQWLLWGPVIGTLLISQSWKKSAPDFLNQVFSRTGVFIYLFLFLFTFFGHVEGNWALAAFPVLLISNFKVWENSVLSKNIVFRGLWISLPLLILGRLVMVFDFLPFKINFLNQLYHQKQWTLELKKAADGRPVVFMNSYQKASKYLFYAQAEASTTSNVMGRKSQFDLLNTHEGWYGKEVLTQINWPSKELDSIQIEGLGQFYFRIDTAFWYFPKTEVVPIQLPKNWQAGQEKMIELKIDRGDQIQFGHPPLWDVSYSIFQHSNRVLHKRFTEHWNPLLKSSKVVIPVAMPLEPGSYQIIFSVEKKWYPAGINGIRFNVIFQ
jgi:hypothetical protein